MTHTPDRALFVMPRDGSQWRNAVGLWVTVAGWAAAGARRFGSSWIVTPGETVDADGALAFTTPTRGRAPARASRVPLVVKTAVKDGRQAVRAERFRRAALPTEAREGPTAFVWQHHDVFARAGSAIAKELGVPLVSYVHAPQVWEAASWGVERPGWGALVERYGERPALLESDVVACVSTAVAQELGRFGVDPARIVVSPMAVDPERFRPDPGAGARVRERLALGDGPVIGWAGTFRGFHGVEDLVEAFARLDGADAKARLLLVGAGPAREQVETLAHRLHLDDRVVFADAVAHVEMPGYLGAMDIAVASANPTGGFHYSPQKLREYLACGCAAIAPDIGEVPGAVEDGRDALLYEAGNVESLEARLRELVESPARRAELARAGREHVVATATWDVRLRDLLESDAFGLSSDAAGL
jgi:glycosyltransferase involved in cell wall biosynthesis